MGINRTITRALGSTRLKIRTNSPHILFGGGVIGVVASTVMACRATLKADTLLSEIKDEIDVAKVEEVNPQTMAYIYGKSSVRLVQAYAPALFVGTVSIGLLTGSHVQMTRRNTALTVAYAGLHKAYMEYRQRVSEAVGPDRERDLYFGAVKEKQKDEKTGKTIEVSSVDPNRLSPYARFFDEGSPQWQKNGELNMLFLKCQQNWANDLLYARGHLFLNEVYDMLGIERSSAGQFVGWVLNSDGDNFVDFGLYDEHNSQFINGREPRILLDFNVDGPVVGNLA